MAVLSPYFLDLFSPAQKDAGEKEEIWMMQDRKGKRFRVLGLGKFLTYYPKIRYANAARLYYSERPKIPWFPIIFCEKTIFLSGVWPIAIKHPAAIRH